LDEIKNFLGLDSLCYLSLAGMLEAAGLEGESSFCLACFNRTYPVQPEHGFSKPRLEP
jgi:amidophosphoribosyltransferase